MNVSKLIGEGTRGRISYLSSMGYDCALLRVPTETGTFDTLHLTGCKRTMSTRSLYKIRSEDLP